MNYNLHMSQLIAALGEDKTISQPYRNSVISSARRLHMEIRGSQTFSNLPLPDMTQAQAQEAMQHKNVTKVCSCPHYPDAIRTTCPIHGDQLR